MCIDSEDRLFYSSQKDLTIDKTTMLMKCSGDNQEILLQVIHLLEFDIELSYYFACMWLITSFADKSLAISLKWVAPNILSRSTPLAQYSLCMTFDSYQKKMKFCKLELFQASLATFQTLLLEEIFVLQLGLSAAVILNYVVCTRFPCYVMIYVIAHADTSKKISITWVVEMQMFSTKLLQYTCHSNTALKI